MRVHELIELLEREAEPNQDVFVEVIRRNGRVSLHEVSDVDNDGDTVIIVTD